MFPGNRVTWTLTVSLSYCNNNFVDVFQCVAGSPIHLVPIWCAGQSGPLEHKPHGKPNPLPKPRLPDVRWWCPVLRQRAPSDKELPLLSVPVRHGAHAVFAQHKHFGTRVRANLIPPIKFAGRGGDVGFFRHGSIGGTKPIGACRHGRFWYEASLSPLMPSYTYQTPG